MRLSLLKNLGILTTILLLGFNISYAVTGEELPPELKTPPSPELKKQIQVPAEAAKNVVTSIKCDSGQALYDKDGKPVGCVVPPKQLNKDPDGKVVSAICDQGSQAYYKDTSGVLSAITGGLIGTTAEFAGCIASPSEVTRAGDDERCAKATPLQVNGTCSSGKNKIVCKNKLVCADLVLGKVRKYETSVKIPCQPSIGPCPSEQTPAGYVARIYTFALMIAGLAAFGGIIYGSLKYILSAGNIGSQQDAKDQITQAVLGIILLLGSFLILYTINPDLVNLRNPNLEPLNLSVLQEPEDAGEQRKNQPGGSGANDDSLCALSVNAGIVLNTNLPGLTSGPKNTGYTCVNCKDNASREGGVAGVGGTCKCNSRFYESGGECISGASCEAIGTPTIRAGYAKCELTSKGDEKCDAQKGTCQFDNQVCAGKYVSNLCLSNSAKNYRCCLPR